MAKQPVSNTLLMGVPADQVLKIIQGKQKAIVKTMLAKATEPPYTIYFYVSGSKKFITNHGMKFPADILYTDGEVVADELKYGCPYDMSLDELKTDSRVLNGTIVAKCRCENYQIMRCSESGRRKYIDDVGMTENQLLDMCNGKDMSVWYLTDIELLQEPKKLEDFDLSRPPQSWCYLPEEELV
jgi:hypothetical protein